MTASAALVQRDSVRRKATRAEFPSFSELYEENAEYIWRVLRRVGLDETAAEDALQEAFIVAFRRRHDFEGRSTLRTWLCGIAIRVARRVRERCYVRAEVEFEDDDRAVAPEAGPERDAERGEALATLEALLGELAPQRREAFVLAEVEGLSAPEMAEILGIPVNTVYSRIRLARVDFEAALKRLRARDRGSR